MGDTRGEAAWLPSSAALLVAGARVELSGVWVLPLHLHCSAWALLAGQTVPGTEGCPQTPLGLDMSWAVPSSSPTTFLLGLMFLGSHGQEGLSWSFTAGPHWKRSRMKPVLGRAPLFWGERSMHGVLGAKAWDSLSEFQPQFQGKSQPSEHSYWYCPPPPTAHL